MEWRHRALSKVLKRSFFFSSNLALKLCGREGELEWSVEVVLLLLGPVHHLPTTHHQKTAVSDVRRVQLEI